MLYYRIDGGCGCALPRPLSPQVRHPCRQRVTCLHQNMSSKVKSCTAHQMKGTYVLLAWQGMYVKLSENESVSVSWSSAFSPKNPMTAATASSSFLNCRANLTSTSPSAVTWGYHNTTHDERGAGHSETYKHIEEVEECNKMKMQKQDRDRGRG